MRWWKGASTHRMSSVVPASLLFAAPALAADWGSATDARACADLAKWSGPESQGEIAKRTKACLADDDMQMDLGNVGYTPSTPNDEGRALCKKQATKEIQKQLAGASAEQAAASKAEKEEVAALQTREPPKPSGRAPAIEKMVTAHFRKLYPEKKLLKIILDGDTQWQVERAANGAITHRSIWATILSKKGDKCEEYGTYWEQQYNGRTFAGSLEEHSHGAEVQREILCTKIK